MRLVKFFREFGLRSGGVVLKGIEAQYPYKLSSKELTKFLQYKGPVDNASKVAGQSDIKEKYPVDITQAAEKALQAASKNKKFSSF